ncbi:hypothetical protein O181_021493 [Austropuccinia psidii MF-1]|uniref:Reverse transcriptase RNase H-like domain-containing protein n=1 Tax=Austropuccinia psidii MF-1 TaxID=1389203 RepID=A0A9Q3GVH1_9BASI|nr:hypothetical protein [Austropuccinia psidii MF-1]
MFSCNFSQIASALRILARDDVEWESNNKFDEAFEKSRNILGEEITLKNFDYEKGSVMIKLSVDLSYIAAGAVITKEDKKGKEGPVLYGSITFSRLQTKYSQPKLELFLVARMLKKLQTVCWSQKFEIKVDEKALIEMINSPCLPNALKARWVVYI